jgi:uncharacterized protein YegP (UPF0339 family)
MHPSRKTFKTVHAPTLRVHFFLRNHAKASRWHWRVEALNGKHIYAKSSQGYLTKAAAQHAFRALQAGLVMGAETVQASTPKQERSHEPEQIALPLP